MLAGLIVGLRAQGVDAYEAAVAGSYIHAQAGLRAAEEFGTTASVLASDVLACIPEIIAELEYGCAVLPDGIFLKIIMSP